MIRIACSAGAAVLIAACAAAPRPAGCPAAAAPLVRALDFAGPDSLAELAFSDPDVWRWSDEGDVPSLELTGASRYQPLHRSPLAIALVSDLLVGDFVLEVELQQTGSEYAHRDLCLFFGFESPERFYYVHLASIPDERAHNVFLVDRAPRRALAPVLGRGVEWGERAWHRVRLERRLADGAIRVFFDDSDEPILDVADRTLGAGRIGFGSFDDTGRFARVRVFAADAREARPEETLFP